MHSDEPDSLAICCPYGKPCRAMRGVIASGISFNGPHCILMSLISWPSGSPRRAMRGPVVS
eukprot:10677481-Karenia_brevis.AAC.1